MGFFDKFKIGFKKSASAFTSGLKEIIIKKEIDDKTLDQIGNDKELINYKKNRVSSSCLFSRTGTSPLPDRRGPANENYSLFVKPSI